MRQRAQSPEQRTPTQLRPPLTGKDKPQNDAGVSKLSIYLVLVFLACCGSGLTYWSNWLNGVRGRAALTFDTGPAQGSAETQSDARPEFQHIEDGPFAQLNKGEGKWDNDVKRAVDALEAEVMAPASIAQTPKEATPKPRAAVPASTSARVAEEVVVDRTVQFPYKGTDKDLHVVVTTGCSSYQNWQSEVLMYSWWKSGQDGQITRIACGCKNELERERVRRTAVKHEGVNFVFYPDFSHFATAKAGDPKGKKFHYFNKPYSMKRWLNETDIKEQVVMLIDPDMIFTKRFEVHVEGSDNYVYEGHPVAQLYGIGDKWTKWGLCDKPSCKVDRGQAWQYYSAGPPYVMHLNDWRIVAPKWVDYSPPAFEKEPWPSILAEMYSYALAAAFYDLKHVLLKTWMVSDVGMNRAIEGWANMKWPGEDRETPEDIHILHYCQGYYLGRDRDHSSFREGGFNWHKGHLPKTILHDCSIPLLVEPEITDANKAKDVHKENRNLWMLYNIITRANDALSNYKETYCEVWDDRKIILLQQPDQCGRMHYTKDHYKREC